MARPPGVSSALGVAAAAGPAPTAAIAATVATAMRIVTRLRMKHMHRQPRLRSLTAWPGRDQLSGRRSFVSSRSTASWSGSTGVPRRLIAM